MDPIQKLNPFTQGVNPFEGTGGPKGTEGVQAPKDDNNTGGQPEIPDTQPPMLSMDMGQDEEPLLDPENFKFQ